MFRSLPAALALSTLCAAQVTYDFNNLQGTDPQPHTPLDTQDGWSEETFRAANRCGVTATLSHDGTQSLQFQEVGPGYGCDASRLNDSSWTFGKLTGTENSLYFEADMLVGFWGGSFGLGYDANANLQIRGAEAGELGVRFTLGTQANVQFRLNAADGTFTRAPLASTSIGGGNWVRVRVVMDLTADAGVGRGYVYYMNHSAGETAFSPVDDLQGVSLGLDPNGLDATNPTFWDGMWLHFEGATYGLDNIEIGAGLARSEEYGDGCGTPGLALGEFARPLIGQTAIAETSGIPSGAVAGGLLAGLAPIEPGIDLRGIGMPNCFLHVASVADASFVPNNATVAHALPIPNTAALVGRSIYLQTVVVAPGQNLTGAITSNGLRWVLGSR